MVLMILTLFFGLACRGEGPTYPPVDRCKYARPPEGEALYPKGHVTHPDVFLQVIFPCYDCDLERGLEIVDETGNLIQKFPWEGRLSSDPVTLPTARIFFQDFAGGIKGTGLQKRLRIRVPIKLQSLVRRTAPA